MAYVVVGIGYVGSDGWEIGESMDWTWPGVVILCFNCLSSVSVKYFSHPGGTA